MLSFIVPVTLLAYSSVFFGKVTGYAEPLACTGACGNSHDPAIIRRDDGTYFRFATNGKIATATAPSITGPWSFKGASVPQGSSIKLKGSVDLWAPDVTKVGNLYYMLYAVSSFGSQDSAIGHATSPDLVKWTDKGATGVESKKGSPYNAIDGNLVSAGGKWYMSWGSFWNDLYIAPVTISDGRIRKSGKETQVAFDPKGGHEMEAPYIFGHSGKFWLFFSAGKCCALDKNRPPKGGEYRIMACLSKGGPEGPYFDKGGKDCRKGGGTTVLPSHGNIYAPGGQGVYNDPKQGPIIYYHYINTKIGYRDGDKKFGWNKLDFSSGWPTV